MAHLGSCNCAPSSSHDDYGLDVCRFLEYFSKFSYHQHSAVLETALQTALIDKTRELGLHRSVSFVEGFVTTMLPMDGAFIEVAVNQLVQVMHAC